VRRTLGILMLLSAGLCIGPHLAIAQTSRADSANVLLQTARRLEAEGNRAAADALLRELLRNFGDTPAAEAARGTLPARPPAADRSGRLELIAWGTIYGAFLGLAVPAALGVDNASTYGAGLLLGPAGGFFVSSAYAARVRPSLGRARALTFGFRWGTQQALLWRSAIGGEPSAQAVWGTMVIGGAAGVAGAAIYTRNRSVSPGLVTAASHGSNWGTWFGLMGLGLFDLWSDQSFKVVLATGDAGLLAALLMTPSDISTGRVWLTTAAGIAGAAAGLGVDLLVQSDNAQLNIAFPTIGSAIGLLAGAKMAKRSEEDSRRLGALDGAQLPSALVEVGEGGARVGFPALTPTLVPVGERGVRRLYRPALAVPLFHAAF
jgi:hypothetical protein